MSWRLPPTLPTPTSAPPGNRAGQEPGGGRLGEGRGSLEWHCAGSGRTGGNRNKTKALLPPPHHPPPTPTLPSLHISITVPGCSGPYRCRRMTNRKFFLLLHGHPFKEGCSWSQRWKAAPSSWPLLFGAFTRWQERKDINATVSCLGPRMDLLQFSGCV